MGFKESRDHITIKWQKIIFGKSLIVNEFLSFDDLALSVNKGESEFGVMAIENSIAGSIIPNYALIDSLDLYIVGEYFAVLTISLWFFWIKNEDIKYVSLIQWHYFNVKFF